MSIKIIEIKSPILDAAKIESLLLAKNARYVGQDHQIDTYFNVSKGRLKLRQGNIENTLIYYEREENPQAKKSLVKIQKMSHDTEGLKTILTEIHGVKTIVDKKRKIFFINNVKFHIDVVLGLGEFVEIEAIDEQNDFSESELKQQCDHYIEYLQLNRQKFIDQSYSDMV